MSLQYNSCTCGDSNLSSMYSTMHVFIIMRLIPVWDGHEVFVARSIIIFVDPSHRVTM